MWFLRSTPDPTMHEQSNGGSGGGWEDSCLLLRAAANCNAGSDAPSASPDVGYVR